MAFLNPLVLTMAGELVESLSLTLVMMREEGRVDIMPDIGDNRVSLTHCAGNIHSHTNTSIYTNMLKTIFFLTRMLVGGGHHVAVEEAGWSTWACGQT